MNNPSRCSDRSLENFLHGELAADDLQQLESHLEGCESCRNTLEESAADAAVWNSVRDLLPDDELDTAQLGAAGTSDPSNERAASDAINSVPAHANRIERLLDLLKPTDDPEMLGRIGPYEVVGIIGEGGMATVLKCRDRSLDRFVAVKVLAPHLAHSAAARTRFTREAQSAAAVIHDNVIAIYGVAGDGDLPYLVMPYESGSSLQKRVESEGPFDVIEIVRIGLQAAKGLAAAHAQGLVHRDVKPANILLANGVERIKITDFGLARAVDDASLTRSGIIAGTPQYMSPEQARGEPVDCQSDLFSLGSVLYTLCVGHAPFRAESSYGVLRRITDDEPTPILNLNPSIPHWLCRLIERLHSKAPVARYPSAELVAGDLEQCLAHLQQPQTEAIPSSLLQPVSRRESGGSTPSSDRSVNRLALVRILGATSILLVALLLWTAFQRNRNSVGGPHENDGTTVKEPTSAPDRSPTLDRSLDSSGSEIDSLLQRYDRELLEMEAHLGLESNY